MEFYPNVMLTRFHMCSYGTIYWIYKVTALFRCGLFGFRLLLKWLLAFHRRPQYCWVSTYLLLQNYTNRFQKINWGQRGGVYYHSGFLVFVVLISVETSTREERWGKCLTWQRCWVVAKAFWAVNRKPIIMAGLDLGQVSALLVGSWIGCHFGVGTDLSPGCTEYYKVTTSFVCAEPPSNNNGHFPTQLKQRRLLKSLSIMCVCCKVCF